MINLDQEITPVRIRSSPNKTVRFNNVEILEHGCSRNMVTGVPNDPTHPNKKKQKPHTKPISSRETSKHHQNTIQHIKPNEHQQCIPIAQGAHNFTTNFRR